MPARFQAEIDPRVKLLLLAVISWLALYTADAYKLLVLTALSLAVPYLSAINIRELLRSYGPMALLITVLSMVGAFWDPRLPWYSWGPIHISGPGLIASLVVSWRVVIILWWALWFTSSTSVRAMTMALEWLLTPLNHLGLKTSGLILALVVAFRFMPELLAEGQSVKEAQQLRGYRDKPGQPAAAAHSLLVMLVPLLTRTWLRAEDLADAISARGYRTGQKQVRLHPLKLSTGDIGVLVGMIVMIVWIIV